MRDAEKKATDRFSPAQAVRAVQAAAELPFDEGMRPTQDFSWN